MDLAERQNEPEYDLQHGPRRLQDRQSHELLHLSRSDTLPAKFSLNYLHYRSGCAKLYRLRGHAFHEFGFTEFNFEINDLL